MDKPTQKIAIGTVQFGLDYGLSNKHGRTPPEEVSRILSYAGKEGVDTLDTAYAYGVSQKVLGQQDLSDFKVVSKFIPEDKDNPSLEKQLDETLSNLKVESLYGFLAHRPMDVLSHPEQWIRLNELKDKEIIQKIGFSFNDPEEVDKVLAKGYIPDLVQAPFNYFDQRFQSKLKKLKADHHCEIHCRSAFLQGLFFMPVEDLPDFFDPVKEEISRLQQLSDKLPAFLIHHVLDKDFIDKVVIGVNNLNQLKQNLRGLSLNLSSLDTCSGKNEYPPAILSPSKWPKA